MFIESSHLLIIQKILASYPYSFYLFGSRVTGKQRPLSDLDLCFFEPISLAVQSYIKEDFEQSNLPYLVDLVDWNNCTNDFQKIIAKDLVCIQKTNASTTIENTIKKYKSL